jgi:hypothetical protein
VLLQPPPLGAVSRRLVARLRERGAVLVAVGGAVGAFESESTLTVTQSSWQGLGDGHGHLRTRRLTIEAVGRRAAVRARRVTIEIPGLRSVALAAERVDEVSDAHAVSRVS